jgi:hypothetical protein
VEALRNVESGNKAWPRTIERIARALGLTPMQLYERAAATADADGENVVPIRA